LTLSRREYGVNKKKPILGFLTSSRREYGFKTPYFLFKKRAINKGAPPYFFKKWAAPVFYAEHRK
jgi:hypothetical protein